MITFNNFPPQNPGDVELSDLGFKMLETEVRRNQPSCSNRLNSNETPEEQVARTLIIGRTLGATLFEVMEKPSFQAAIQLATPITKQYRDAMQQPNSEIRRRFAQALGGGMYLGINEAATVNLSVLQGDNG